MGMSYLSYSQDLVPAASYCYTDGPVNLMRTAPPNKTWTCNVAGVITNTGGGAAIFYPASVPGPYPVTISIIYQTFNYTGEPAGAYDPTKANTIYSVIITSPPAVTFAAIPDQCVNTTPFVLTQGNPAGGVYSGTGVVGGNSFNPSLSGAGTFLLTYTYPASGCTASATQWITVNAIPIVTLQDFTPICTGTPAFILTQGAPAGGTYSGTGVAGGVFDPAVAGVGTHTITYTVVSGTCSASTSKSITVNPLPAVTFSGLNNIVPAMPWYCDSDPIDNLIGAPLGGSFTGAGTTNIAPAGNGTFNPQTSGLGEHDITYTYTDVNGCTNSQTLKTRVGTMIYINGLDPQYCQSAAIDNFNYTPWAAFPTSTIYGNGVTDLFNGNATFNPATAALGNNTVTYEYTDASGCLNSITQTVAVEIVPIADFSGLNAASKYCSGAADVLLTGNYAPSGTFTGPAGSIVDNGNGTATFSPSVLGVGTYSITYTYTNATGCTDSETKTVEILQLPSVFNVTGGGTFCATGAGLSVGLANSVTGISYQLYRGGVAIAPANIQPGSTGNPIDFGLQNVAGSYTVIATDPVTGCSSTMTGSATIFVTPQATITVQPTDVTVCEDGSTSVSITVSGVGLNYQWMKNGAPVGVNNNVLVLNNLILPESGHVIYCDVTSTCGGPLKSNDITLTVNPKTAITTDPSDAVRCTGSGVSFSIVAAGINNTYQWKKGAANVTDLAGKVIGSNTSSLTILNLTAADAGLYSCVVTGNCGPSVQSTQATLSVNDPIVITTQPTSQTACTGGNITFSIAATGTSLSYQWQKNTVDIPGATNLNYSIIGIVVGDAATYRCKVTSPCGASSLSNNATLTIPANTVISTNPSSTTVCEGSSAILSVSASGNSLLYEWYKNGVLLLDNAIVSNSSTPNISFNGITAFYQDTYWVNVIGTCGTVSSSFATITVKTPVTFTTQPANQTVCANSDATFSVATTGDVVGYQWQRDVGLGYVNIAGATNTTYIQTNAQAADIGSYRCMVTTSNCGGPFYSSAALLNVNPTTAIITQPVSKNSCAGSSVSFSVVSSGTALTYQWYKNSAVPANIIAGATNSSITLPNITPADAADYICIVMGICGTAISTPGKLTVDIGPIIGTHPQSQTVCPGMATSLSVVVTSGTNLTYQWKKDGVNIGINSPAYSIAAFAPADAGSYVCEITNNCGTVVSNAAVLSIGAPVNITSNPSSISICTGSVANFTVVVTGSNLIYQWQKDNVSISNGGTISGANSATLTINGVVAGDAGSYKCIVSNSCNTQTSTSATLTISQTAIITQQPQNEVGCLAQPLNIVTIATGTNLNYQWYKNGVPTGLNNPVYAIGSYVAGDAGTYRCEITNGCGTVVSDNAIITTGLTTNITAQPISETRCIGSDVNFLITAIGTNLTYQWKKDGVAISDNGRISATNTNSLSITGVILSDIGTYTCDAIGSCTTVTSDGAVLTVKNPVLITDQPDNLSVCNGSNAIFNVTATGDDLTYSWQKGGAPILPAETTASLVLTGVNAASAGVYNCRVSNTCSFEISTAADLIVENNLLITAQPNSVTQCEGTNVSFTVGITGPSTTTYQWYKGGAIVNNGVRITGATSPILNINTITLADVGSYSCKVFSPCGNDESDIANLSVLSNVAISVQPASFSVLIGNTATFTVVATGSVTGYQWKKDGINLVDGGNISGALTANLSISNAAIADQGAYTCLVSGSCNNIPSNAANLTVLLSSVITTQPTATVTICEGGTLNLFITTAGGPHTYRWRKNGVDLNDDVRTSGSTTATLTISNLIATDQAAYTCLVDGTESSSPSVVQIYPSTTITTQPLDATRCEGNFVTFVINGTGANLTYQWQKNNANIGGATNSTYTINPLVDGDDGIYTCIISGTCGSKTSNPATLVVNKNTIISGQPTGGTICEGVSTTISIVADGDNLTYQWLKNGSNIVNGGNISGATSNSLQISNALTSDAGSYSCIVSGACGNVTSNFATLVVNPQTNITTHPLNFSKCEGDNVQFTVNATGIGLTYQWKKDGFNVINDGNITGATTSTLNIAAVTQLTHQGTYTCSVTGGCGATKTSNPGVLTINGVTSISSQPPASVSICQNSSTTINITATGGNLTYQWKKNGFALVDGGNISGATSNSLTITNALTSDVGFYSCTVTGTCGSETSQMANLQVNPTTVITSHPAGQTLCEGDNVQFAVTATGSGLTYQWKKDNLNIALATNSTFTIINISSADAGGYTCAVTGLCGVPAISNTANLVVNSKVVIGTQPVDVTVCDENVAIFSLLATGTNLTYQWQKNNNNIPNGGRVSGATTNQLQIASSINSDEGIFKCTVSSNCGIVESNSVILSVTDSTVITAHPVSQTLLQGLTATFNVAATGANLTYQWQKNNVDIAGATSSSYSIVGVVPGDAGNFKCIVTGSCGIVTSNIAILTVNQLVGITAQPASLIKCVNDNASFTIATSGTVVSYQWQFNGVNIIDGGVVSGSKTTNLVISSVALTHAGTYSCIVTGSSNIANSNPVTLTVNQQVSITQQPLTQTKCDGDILILEVAPNDPTYTYTWTFNGAPVVGGGRISGETTSKLVITSAISTDAGTYRCTVSNICGTIISNPAIVTIKPVVTITSQPSDLTQCETQTGFFSVVANISTVSYEWYKNGGIITDGGRISGATSANLVISNLTPSDAGNYSCRVYDNCSYDNSIVASLIVKSRTLISKQPTNMSVCEGSAAFFEVQVTPAGLTYQWQKDGVNLGDILGKIEGSGTSVLVIKNANIADVGVYRCLITGGCNDEITTPSNLTVNAYPGAAGAVSGIQTVCQGDVNVLYVVPNIANTSTYKWDVPYGATIVNGIGTRTIQVNYTNSSLSGAITVYGQNGCGNGTPSAPLAITVNPLPIATANIDQIVCGTTTSLNANPVAGIWTILSGDAIISNSNLFNSGLTNIKKGDNEFIWSVSQAGCTARDTIKITNAQVTVNAGLDQTICENSTNLNATTPLTGATWTVISGVGVIANSNSPTTLVSQLAQDINRFAWQVNNLGCISRDTVTIYNYRPMQPNAGIDQTIDYDFTTLDASIPEAGTSRFWTLVSGSGTFANINDPKTTITNLLSGTNILVWNVTRNSCTLTDTVIIENIMIEDPDAGLNQTLCVNNTTLNAKYPVIGTGEWSVISGTAIFTNKNSNTSKVTNLGHGANWLKWTVRTSGLGMKYDTVLIVNNETTLANAGPDLVLCTDSINLMANTPIYGTGFWTLISGSGQVVNTANPSSLIRKLGQGKNDVKWTITYLSCISEDFVSITNNTPTTAYAGLDQTICLDSTVLFPNTPSIGTANWSLVSGSGLFKVNTVTNLAPDVNVFRYNITKGSCTSYDDVTIINNKPTTPDAGYDQSLCTNSVTLNANPAIQGTGAWTIINGSGTFSNSTANNSTVTGLTTGMNIFRWTITKNGCSEHDEVIISSDFVQATAGSDVNLCVDNTQLKGSNPLPGIGFWSIVGTSGATFDNQSLSNTFVRNLSKGANTLRWTVRNGVCESTDDVVITNNEPTKAFAGENQAICGDIATLQGNIITYGTGTWTIMSGTGALDNSLDPKTTIRSLGVGKNILRWTSTLNSCISYSEVTITNNKANNVFAGNDQIACSDTAILLANPPTIGTGSWLIISGSGTFDNPNSNSTKIRKLGKGRNILKWTVTSSDCHVIDTVVITSSVPTKAIAGADQILCSETATLGGNQPIVGTGQWTLIGGAVQFTDPLLPKTTATGIARGTSTLRWTITENGCESHDDMLITNNQPSAPFAGYDQSVCGDSTRLFADPPTIGTGVWTLVSGDASILTTNSNQTRVVNIKFGDNTFRWRVTNKNCTLYDDVIIRSDYAYSNAGIDRDVNTSSIQLIGNVPASGTGTWTISAGQATIANPTQFDTWVNNLGAGANVFTWSINNNGCIASDEVTINYIVLPTANFTPLTTEGCSPFTVSFVNTSIGGTPYSWDFGDGTTSNETNISHTFNDPGTYKIILTASGPLGQLVKKEGKVTVYGHPKATFDISPKLIYIPGQLINTFNYSDYAKTSIWDFGDGTDLVTALAPKHTFSDTGKFDITLKVINTYNCADSITMNDIVHVKKRSEIFFPEAFTPNPNSGSGGTYDTQDRSNDVFYPIIIDGEITDYEMYVYNREGVLVFQSKDIKKGWDGYYKGKVLPQDIYIYKVTGRFNSGDKFQIVHNVLLVRKDN